MLKTKTQKEEQKKGKKEKKSGHEYFKKKLQTFHCKTNQNLYL